MAHAVVCKTIYVGSNPTLDSKSEYTLFDIEGNMEKEKNLEEVKNNTPQIISANDLIGLPEDNEDWLIYERRCAERGY